MMATSPKHRSAKEYLPRVLEYSRHACTRADAFQRVSEETGISVSTLRVAAMREGLITKDHSLKFIFSEEEEDALVAACVIYSRQGTPLTVKAFIILASRFAGYREGQFLSYQFAHDFIERKSLYLCMKHGKQTSPTRCMETMQQLTENFDRLIEKYSEKNIINSNNIVVFDETKVGDVPSLPLCIGESRDSGGKNVNFVEIQEATLGCYILFSMPDGQTSFRVFIFKNDKIEKGVPPSIVYTPADEIGLRRDPLRLFLQSKTGFLTLELFEYIMEEFTKFWNITRPGLHCFLICDNLRSHHNNEVFRKEFLNGIHMFYIMPGSSHWFQVHDQLPFANLKKNMTDQKNAISPIFSLPHQERRKLLMAIFYDSERKAFAGNIVRRSFADVGLWPFNPDRIFEICEKHSPAHSSVFYEEATNALIDTIKEQDKRRVSLQCQLLTSIKPASLSPMKKSEIEECEKQKGAPESEEVEEDPNASVSCENMDTSYQLPKKRPRVSHLTLINCAVTGCKNTHFRSKMWLSCPKCKKQFCPKHYEHVHLHDCI